MTHVDQVNIPKSHNTVLSRTLFDYWIAVSKHNRFESSTLLDSYSFDAAIGTSGRGYDFMNSHDRRDFYNHNCSTEKGPISILAITHNTTGRLTDEHEYAYNQVKRDYNYDYPLIGKYTEEMGVYLCDSTANRHREICLDISFVITNQIEALGLFSNGVVNYRGRRVWQQCMIELPNENSLPEYKEHPEDEPKGRPTVILSRHADGTVNQIPNNVWRRHVY